MTAATMSTLAGERSLLHRVAILVRNLPRRLRERAFWVVQAGVLGVTAGHILAELWAKQTDLELPTVFHHIPVILYLAPISYASLRFGTEGAVLTGLWSGALTVPNLVIWHRAGFEWLEIIYVIVVVVIGVVMAVPVERERQQRRRAEATSQRLALLDHIATLMVTADLRSTVDETLRRLLDMLQLEAACVAVVDSSTPSRTLSMLGADPVGSPSVTALVRRVCEWEPQEDHAAWWRPGPDLVAVPLAAELPGSGPEGRVRGMLAAKVDPARPLTEGDQRLLAGVASHLAVAVANDRLAEAERNRLRSYALQITQAQEEERKRIARELHDEASQNVVVIRRSLSALAASFHAHPAAGDLSELSDLAGQTLAGLRRFSRDLRPPTLDQLGLSSALDQLVTELRERNELAAELRVAGRPRRLPIETELAVFRIGQAALHNVERHATAGSVVIELAFEADRVRLEIADDGAGFEPPENLGDLPTAGKLGLVGMRERAQLVGGSLQIHSRPGAGTHVILEVPG